MGWASGSRLADEVWAGMKEYIPVRHRSMAAQVLANAFSEADCDTLDDCEFVRKYLAYDEESGQWEVKHPEENKYSDCGSA